MGTEFVQDEAGVWWHYFPDGRRIRGKQAKCEGCGGSFLAYRKKRFCSDKCRDESRRVLVDSRTCPRCGREFVSSDKRQVFCSHRCAAEAIHAARPVTTGGIDPEGLVGSDNPRYTQDDSGQWWYTPGGPIRHTRTRAFVSTCKRCGRRFLTNLFHRKKQTHCSKSCGLKAVCTANPDRYKGEKGGNWKGGRYVDKRGYVQVWAPGHHSRQRRNGGGKVYVQEHRLVMEAMLGRYLHPYEFVHHRNGVKTDNRPENLELWEKGHPSGQRSDEILRG